MINFFYETKFEVEDERQYKDWILRVILSEGKLLQEVNYIFCDDYYLHKINMEYLDHDTYTDIISFDNSKNKHLAGDIFVSIERVKENAKELNEVFEEELRRVLVHGILHFCGYNDKSKEEKSLMRSKEDEKLKLFHVER